MLQQLVQYLQGIFVEWLMSIAVPEAIWGLLGRLYGGIGTLISWTPAAPYVPFAAMSLAVSVVIGTWLLLFGIGMMITWASRLKP